MQTLLFILILAGIVFAMFQYLNSQGKIKSEKMKQTKPSEPTRQPLSEAEREAIRQADEAFDWDTHNAIVSGTYDGPLPDYNGAYWSQLYPNIYHTKIAGINFSRGIKNLAGVYFDALLIPEPTNKYDSNAIKIIHATDRRKLGYIPADETDSVRRWVSNQFPYPCRAHIDDFEDYDEETDKEVILLKGEINILKQNLPNVSPYQK